MGVSTTRARASIALVVAALAVIGVTVPASASTLETPSPEILMSSDGSTFAPTIDNAIFGDVGLIVPGDVDTVSFWIRNPIDAPVEMRVSLSTLSTNSVDMATNMTLTALDAESGSSTTAALSTLAACYVLVPSRGLAPGATMQVDLSLEMLDVSGQRAQNSVGDMTLLVAMRDAEAGAFPANDCDETGAAVALTPSHTRSGPLAYTGMTMHYDWFALAAGALGFGFLMLLRRRRERSEDKS